jgi:hypothetical protein
MRTLAYAIVLSSLGMGGAGAEPILGRGTVEPTIAVDGWMLVAPCVQRHWQSGAGFTLLSLPAKLDLSQAPVLKYSPRCPGHKHSIGASLRRSHP